MGNNGAATVNAYCLFVSATAKLAVTLQGAWDMMGQQEPTGPALWSAEEPNLYILVLSLLAPDGSHIESESCQVMQ